MSASWPPPGPTSRGHADNQPYVFRAKFADETLDYSLPLSLVAEPAEDVPVSVSVAAAPSGSGELVLDNPVADENAVWVKIAGGQPGRIYTLKYSAEMQSGHVREVIATLTITRALPSDTPQAAPSDEFGSPVEWSAT